MKIGVFTYFPSYSHFFPMLLNTVLLELGYDSTLQINDTNLCKGNDVTLCCVHNRWVPEDIMNIKAHNSLVVLLQTQQMGFELGEIVKKYTYQYINIQDFVDINVECGIEIFDFMVSISKKPVLLLKFGYHPSLRTFTSSDLKLGWDIFKIESVLPYRKKIEERMGRNNIVFFKDNVFDPITIGNYSRCSKICLNTYSYISNNGPIFKHSYFPSGRIISKFMANSGFVMSEKYDFEGIVDGKHIVYFDNNDDMIDKMKYYLIHQDEARQITDSAFNYISTHDLFIDSVKEIMDKIIEHYK
jgi:hypothetical protein